MAKQLNLKKLLGKILGELKKIDDRNRPIAEGVSGKWSYRVWKNHTFELWYNSGQTTVTTGTSSGNGWYRNTNEYTVSIPQTIFTQVSVGAGFWGVDHVSVTVNTNYANLIVSVTHGNDEYFGFYVSHLGQLSSAEAYVSAYVTGTWEDAYLE